MGTRSANKSRLYPNQPSHRSRSSSAVNRLLDRESITELEMRDRCSIRQVSLEKQTGA